MTSWSLSESGFGLIQILFIALAVAIAASVAVMNADPLLSSGGSKETYARMDRLREAAALYRAHGNGAPSSIDALFAAPNGAAPCAPDTNPSSSTFRQLRGWCGPYVQSDAAGSDLPKRDGWKNLLQYSGTTLRSCGPNRTCGDADDISISI